MRLTVGFLMRFCARIGLNSHASLFLMLATCLSASIGHGDELRDTLDSAIKDYEADLAAIEREVDQSLSELFDLYADKGDLDKAKKIESLADTFRAEAVLPDDPLVRAIREKAKIGFERANRAVRTAYREAVVAYTKARNLRAADDVRRSLEEFNRTTSEERLLFPKAEKRKAASPKSPPQASKPPSAPPGQKQPHKLPGKSPIEPSKELLAAINAGPEREILGNALASLSDKEHAIWLLYGRVTKTFPARSWTLDDVDYLSSVTIAYHPNCKVLVCPDELTLRDGELEVTFVECGEAPSEPHYHPSEPGAFDLMGPNEPTATHVYSRFRVAWLVASPSVEDFLLRVKALKGRADLRSIDLNFGDEDFKVWLNLIGCKNREEIEAVLNKLRDAGVAFTAVKTFAQRAGL
jgi:Skp family chaperone for outer membrane proteins